jgi:hypothetical protein
MLNKHRIMGQVGTSRRFLVAIAVMALAALGVASSASAQPKGEFAVFGQCPLGTAKMNACIYSPTTSGYIKLGKQEVPIVKEEILQGGLLKEKEPFVKELVAAKNGETLTRAAQKVPGGLAGLVECNKVGNFLLRISCEAIFENGLTGVNAVTELAAPASTIYLNTAAEGLGEGTALNLPIKVHLENPLLGSECYIGSNTEPINIDLSTGATTGGPTGKPGTEGSKEEGKILELSGVSLVSNTFAAPGATGCGLFGLLDGILNSKIGLPSAAGKNTAVLNGKVEIANAVYVEDSEG